MPLSKYHLGPSIGPSIHPLFIHQTRDASNSLQPSFPPCDQRVKTPFLFLLSSITQFTLRKMLLHITYTHRHPVDQAPEPPSPPLE